METFYFDRYDVMINAETGEILDICKCKPGTCEFTDLWISDGSPTHIEVTKI